MCGDRVVAGAQKICDDGASSLSSPPLILAMNTSTSTKPLLILVVILLALETILADPIYTGTY